MRIWHAVLWLGLLSGCARAGQPAPVQVIELYQSQGCSSCPPANAVLNSLADRSDLITLSFSVTYWDYLGWKDSFAQPAFTHRQTDYAAAAHRPGVATPQMVINGRGFITGMTQADVEQGLKRYARTSAEPQIAASAGKVSISQAPAEIRKAAAQVWWVAYEPKNLDVPISAGENNGRTLPHRHIVRQLVRLGEWSGQAESFNAPPLSANLRTAILLQQGTGGPIVAAKGF